MSQDLVETTGSKRVLSEVLNALNDCTLLHDSAYYDQEVLCEYKNFKPARSLELLTERFSSGVEGQPPTAFIEEMKTLISWSNTVIQDQKLLEKMEQELKNQSLISMISGLIRETPIEKKIRKYVPLTVPENVKSLEKKYGIVKSGNATEVITYSRLRFLFPNFLGLESEGLYGEKRLIPQMFSAPEFGGLIPAKHFKAKKAIIAIHLICLLYKDRRAPLYVHHLFLKKRIDEGLLSDEKRLRFLIAHRMVEPDGDFTEKLLNIYKTLHKLCGRVDTYIEKAEQINGFSLTQNDYVQ